MASLSPFSDSASVAGPGSRTVDVSAEKHATNFLSFTVRAIRADGAGTLVFHAVGDGDAVTRTVTVVAGEVFDLCYIDRVLATSTATGMLGVV